MNLFTVKNINLRLCGAFLTATGSPRYRLFAESTVAVDECELNSTIYILVVIRFFTAALVLQRSVEIIDIVSTQAVRGYQQIC